MPVELERTYITPYPEKGYNGPGTYQGPIINAGQSYPPNMPNPIGSSLFIKTDQYCSPNCLVAFEKQAHRDGFGIQTKVDLKAIAAADQKAAEGHDLKTAFKAIGRDISAHPQIHENIIKYPAVNRVLSGGVLTPFHALAHSISGRGEPIRFPIENVGLKVNARTIPGIMNVINRASLSATSPVDLSFPYDVGKDSTSSWLTLGHITLRVVGSVGKDASGAWIFNGEIRAFNDVYDANPSTHRTWLGESLTALLRKVPLTSYQIVIDGAIPVTISGN